MAKLKVYYDGWLALPAALRHKLDLGTDAVLEAELVDGIIVLQPAARTKSSTQPAPEPQTSQPPADVAAAAPSTLVSAPAKRKPGRPRKVPAGEQLELVSGGMPNDVPLPAEHEPEPRPETHVAEPLASITALKRPRGRPRKAAMTEETDPASLASEAGSELRRKLVLPTAIHQQGPVRGRRATRPTSGAGHEREERRPFARVEVRKLGTGRGHNKPRRLPSQP